MIFYAPLSIAAPDIQTWETDSGVPVYFVEAHELPMVQVSFGFDAGSVRDPESLLGISSMVAGMLDQGADGLDANQLAEAIESTGARISAGSDRDKLVVSLRSLTEADLLARASAVFKQMIGAPDFPESALERERARRLIGLQRQKQSPGAMAQKAYSAALYAGHAYGRPASGDEQTITQIQKSDLLDFHSQYFVRQNLVVAVVGAMTRSEVEAWVEDLVSVLPEGAPAPAVDTPEQPPASRQFIPFESQQSTILLGHHGVQRGHPDFIPLSVANYILGGGGLVSLLSDELREKRGLTYGVSSGYRALTQGGSFSVRLQTRNDKRDEAVALVRSVVDQYVNSGPSEEQLENAIRHLSGSFPLSTDSNAKVARILMAIAFYQLPVDYLQTYIDKVETVDLERVNEVIRQHMRPSDFVEVVLGGAAEADGGGGNSGS